MGTTVKTQQGRIEGDTQHGTEVFRGIPYARPPVGDLRFCAPEPPAKWAGVKSMTSFGSAAPQIGPVNRLIRTLIGAAGSRQSQDCLYLNVWTPAADHRRRPVMVWLHGGAFILGSGSTGIYAGWRLAERGDLVVVTINYRLGALGFLSFNGLDFEGDRPHSNVGLRDQIAALEWVRDNIEAFGGDPDNVTVFGESAGAMSTATLLAVPRAKGLFHKAILQSGAAHNVSSPELSDRVARHYVEGLEIDGGDRKQLMDLSVTALMRAQARTSAKFGLTDGVMAWQPCIDGDLIPEQPLAAVERGAASDVPLLIGTNRDEWKLFMTTDRFRFNDRTLAERFRQLVPGVDEDGQDLADRAQSVYHRVVGPRGGEPSERWAAFQSDRIFHYPAMRLADLHSDRQANTYAYLFEWTPPVIGSVIGACHGLDLPFVFGGIRTSLLRVGLVTNPSAQRLCDHMQGAWIAFAHHGDPNHLGLPKWPAYSREDRFTMSLRDQCSLREDPHRRSREFWETAGGDAQPRFF